MPKKYSNRYTIFFVALICIICATILSILSIALAKPQKEAEELYSSQQLLIAARILSNDGYFTTEENGKFVHAKYEKGKLLPDPNAPKAKAADILSLFNSRVNARLVNPNGELVTFQEAKIPENLYLEAHAKTGYAKLDYKLLYVIKGDGEMPYGYVIPIYGFGLWDALYGYICIKPDANTVIGTAWYDQKETPGLGAEISTAEWQAQFHNKQIFTPGPNDQVNFETSPLGIDVMKGKARNNYSVDGIPGATVTSSGVAEAYRQSLSPYRKFLINAHNLYLKNKQGK